MDPSTLFAALQEWTAATFAGNFATRLTVTLVSGERLSLPVPRPGCAASKATAPQPFVPNAVQTAILEALDGAALRSGQLANVVGNKSQVYQRPGGIAELLEMGLVSKHPRLGYYRADAPPSEIEGGG